MKTTIVFADNERRIRQYCKQELENAGYRVLLAEDGEDVLDVVETFAVDLVVLDEHMPRCNGLEAAKRLKQWYPHLPLVLYTADGDYERFQNVLFDATVIKSEDITALMTAIISSLSSPRVKQTEPFAPHFCGFLGMDVD